MRRAAILPLLLLAAAVAAEAAGGPDPRWRFVHEGLAVELAVAAAGAGAAAPREGDHAHVRFRVTDTATGTPVGGLYPAAWVDRLPGRDEGPDTCRRKVETFLGGSLLARPALDLNVYYVLALNDDATISVVDPLFGYGASRLLAMVFLRSPGEDWALAADGDRLFVSLPESDRVAVVETASWKVALELPTGRRPGRMALQPDGQYLWVADGADAARPSGVTVLDARRLRRAGTLETGRGPHELAFSADSRWAFVTNAGEGTVSVLDVAELRELRRVATGGRPVSVAWSEAARAAYVVDAAGGAVVAIDPERPEPVARIELAPGLGMIRFAPGGRLGFVVHPGKGEVHILDTARNRRVQTADVEAEPDEVAFSDELAYVRHRGSETVLMIPLREVGVEGRPVPVVDFPGGEHPPGRSPKPSPAAGIVQAPGAAAALVANPLDRAIYYYKEGMAAPMGHFRNYGRQPRAVLVLDRSLRETAPGTYGTVVRWTAAGDHEVALLLDSPRLVHCFPLRIEPNPTLARDRSSRPLLVEHLTATGGLTAGREVPLRFRLLDPATGRPRSGVADAGALTFLVPGAERRRSPAREVEPGVYEARFRPAEPGMYYVFVEVPSVGLAVEDSGPLVLEVGAAEALAATERRP